MRVAAFLDALRLMPVATIGAVTEGRPFVVISPHPDDESLGTGGLIAAACAAGQRVDVAILTDGSGSHPGSCLYPPTRLIALRREEAARAAAALGLPSGRLSHLDIPDAQAPTDGQAFERAVDRLQHIVETAGARTLFVTWGRDPHCDHEAADLMGRALRRRDPGMKLWSYPIWGWHLDPDAEIDQPPPRGYRIDITRWADAKRAALAAHASQTTDLIADDPQGFRFDERTIAPFIGPFEYVFEVPA